MLLVNFEFIPNKNGITELLRLDSSITSILDFSNTLKKHKELLKVEIIYPVEIDKQNNTHKIALNNYISNVTAISNLRMSSGKKIREIRFGDFPIYWLTNISLKHAQLSILKNIYYFIELAKDCKSSLFSNNFLVILPIKEEYYDNFIRNRVKNELNQDVNFKCFESSKIDFESWSRKSFIKGLVTKYNNSRIILSKTTVKTSASTAKNLIFTFPNSTWNSKNRTDNTFQHLETLLNNQSTSQYLPMVFSIDINNVMNNWDKKWDLQFLKYFPGKIDFFIFLFRTYFLIKKIDNVVLSNHDKCIYIDEKILKRELKELIYLNNGFLFYYIWLKKYFKKLKTKTAIFYQDEFYLSGRIISQAAKQSKNKNLISYGVQHGLFFPGHTVYTITDSEIKGNFSMPVPEKFVVWGNYFKKMFLSNNSFQNENIIVAGNLKYKNSSSIIKTSERKNSFLWCTTTLTDTLQMFDIIRDVIVSDSTKGILIRCHPQFDIKETIINLFSSIGFYNYQFSMSDNIVEDLAISEALISSCASTTFIDGLICNVPVMNIVMPDYYFVPLEVNNLFYIKDKYEFEKCLHYIKNNILDKFNSEELNVSATGWNSLIVENG